MSNQLPFFQTGATAKIRVNGVTLAFATDIQYSVSVKHAAARVLGMYEAHSLEPLMYEVSGSFSVIRYTKDLKNFLGGDSSPDLVENSGNGIGTFSNAAGKLATIGMPFSDEGKAHESFDPSKLHNSMMFDIELYQTQPHTKGMVARLKDCRIIGSDYKMSKRAAVIQTFRFMACYADEDSFNAVFSGVGQHL